MPEVDFLYREYLQHAQTSLPADMIHGLGLYSTEHFKQGMQSHVIHADYRAHPEMLTATSEGVLCCDWHYIPGIHRAAACTVWGRGCPTAPNLRLGAPASCPAQLCSLQHSRGGSSPPQCLPTPLQINTLVRGYKACLMLDVVFCACLRDSPNFQLPLFISITVKHS